MGKGAIEARGPLALPAMGLPSKEASLGPLEEADLAVCVGYDLVEWSPAVWNRDGGKRVRLVDSTVAEVDRHSVPSAEVVGEIGDSLRTLTRAVEGATGPRWDWQRYRDRSSHHARNRDDSFPLKPERVVDDLCDALDDEDVLISDVGVHKLWRPPAPRPGGRTP